MLFRFFLGLPLGLFVLRFLGRLESFPGLHLVLLLCRLGTPVVFAALLIL
jgi:hypothetical protein